MRDDLFIIPSLKSCLRNQLTSNGLYESEEPDFTEQLNSYSKDLAKEIILDLIGATGIDIQEFDKLAMKL